MDAFYEFFDVDWMTLGLPFAYILVLGGSLYTFSSVYRKRKAVQSANLEPWFGPHLQRNIYLSLLHLEPESGQEKSVKVPDSVIRAALLRRAVEDIKRIISVRTSKQALNSLLQRGSVGDDLNQRFLRAEKEIEEEIKDVVAEANALCPSWGQTIFQSANEIHANTILRGKLMNIEDKTAAEKEWWEKRRETIQKDFMKELDEEETKETPQKVGSDDDAVMVDSNSNTPSGTPTKKKKGKK